MTDSELIEAISELIEAILILHTPHKTNSYGMLCSQCDARHGNPCPTEELINAFTVS